MKIKHCLILVFVLFDYSSCKNNSSLKNRTEQFIKDSLLKSFIDKKTFEIVTINYDSVFNHTFIKKLKSEYSEELKSFQISSHNLELTTKILKNQKLTNHELYKQKMEEFNLVKDYLNERTSHTIARIDSCDRQLFIQDSLHHINIRVNYNAKNRIGENIVDSALLIFDPKTERFQIIW